MFGMGTGVAPPPEPPGNSKYLVRLRHGVETMSGYGEATPKPLALNPASNGEGGSAEEANIR